MKTVRYGEISSELTGAVLARLGGTFRFFGGKRIVILWHIKEKK